jgi:hypothetical protein
MAPPTYSPHSGGFISLTEARDGISEYKASDAFDANQHYKAHYFGSDHVKTLLEQNDCIGIRIWYGIGPNEFDASAPQLYIVGVDSNGNDILPTGNEKILDHSLPCPTYCPTGTSLEG